MKYKDGQYYYAPLRSTYAVYLYHESENGGCGDKIIDNLSLQQAKQKVYELNGWNNIKV